MTALRTQPPTAGAADRSTLDGPPTVSVIIPTFQEEQSIGACLECVGGQTYGRIVQVLVVDGRSDDRTRDVARTHHGVTVLDNPRRIQAAALNIGLEAAVGEVIVRVDGHALIEPEYVSRCVETLERTGATMTGGAMRAVASGAVQGAIAAAMGSPLGAGPARFHGGGRPGWVDTVYLGAYRTEVARQVGGYAEDVGVNEDAELAHRMAPHGGIWFEPTIRSEYRPRGSLRALGRQFYRYGLSRAATVRKFPESMRWRQLAAPGLLLGMTFLPCRRHLGTFYAAAVAAAALALPRADVSTRAAFALALPTMHASWAAGFLLGSVGVGPPKAAPAPDGATADEATTLPAVGGSPVGSSAQVRAAVAASARSPERAGSS